MLGKKSNQTFWGLLDTGSELTLVSGDSKKYCGPPVKVGTSGGKELMEFWLSLPHSWSSGPLDSVCGYFPVPKYIMG